MHYYTPSSTVPILLLPFLLLIAACSQDESDTRAERFDGRYVAHLQLDSTRLVVTELMDGLETPWNIMLGSDGWLWINEHNGTVSRVNTRSGEHEVLLRIPDVHFERARGLLSGAIHPDFDNHPYLFFHHVYTDEEENSFTRIVRYRFESGALIDRTVILDALPGGNGHNGSRMVIGSDGKLWLGYGDAMQAERAQDPDTYLGKVLRMNLDGSVPEDNPFGNRIWSSGHRNIQGLTEAGGRIYASEHGTDNDDEINLILRGRNYGWPDVQGYCDSPAEQAFCRDSLVVEPIWSFNPVVAPAGLEYYDHDAIPEWKNSLLLANLRIQAFRVLNLDESGESIEQISIYFQQRFGRLRDLAVGRDGTVYLATSNMDWYKLLRPDIHDVRLEERGDRILMIRPEDDRLKALYGDHERKSTWSEDRVALYLGDTEIADDMSASEQLYVTHCASCHRPDGAGMERLAPPLAGNALVEGDTEQLIRITLHGIDPSQGSSEYDGQMPPFRHLEDEELAAILTWIRGSFSEGGGAIRSDEISPLRP